MTHKETFIQPHWLLGSGEDCKQEFALLISSPGQIEQSLSIVKACLHKENQIVDSEKQLSESTFELLFEATTVKAWDLFQSVLTIADEQGFDISVVPQNHRTKKLLICDMDSTIVASETLDDVAAKVGIGEQVKQITERAMRGELDFRQALDERVGLLKGLPEKVFNDIANEVELNPGAEQLIKQANANNIKTVLVSGGFEPIVKVVVDKLGFDRYVCNKLEIKDGQLTGSVIEPIVDASTKLNVLKEECQNLNIELHDACTIGDGANDLPMIEAAGLGISYYGKPLLRETIPYQINVSDLKSALTMMGIVS
ncbi:MAG: phosphoserine phosphatase SerB [Gammaproteobacteria bacterium]|jgi:phosphoserine phosphatase